VIDVLAILEEAVMPRTDRRERPLDDSLDRALAAARAASDKLAEDLLILDVQSVIGITDYFVICSGRNERQVQTIIEEIEKRLATEGVKPLRREGEHQHRWVLLDYGDFIAHVFHEEERQYYELERLWKDAARIPAEPEAAAQGRA
jgi:ribosome-associated protein